jgi:hypothetical protein
MPGRRARVVATAATLIVAGLSSGLALGAGEDTTGSAPLPGGAASVAQQDAQLVTTTDPAVPTTRVPTETSNDDEGSIVTTEATVGGVVVEKPRPPAVVTGVAVGSAQRADVAERKREATASCAARPPKTSPMFGVGSASLANVARAHRSPTALLFGIAVVAGLIAVGAIAWRRRGRGKDERAAPQTALEVMASTVAIVGTLATVAVAYLGAGAKEHPPPSVAMTIRKVHPRITHGTFARHVPSTTTLEAVDRREIGDVVWVEMRFASYRGADLTLLALAFEEGETRPFIPGTERTTPVHVSREVETQILPIWVGSPRVRRFRVELRLMDADGQLRQIASTNKLKGIAYRYACSR